MERSAELPITQVDVGGPDHLGPLLGISDDKPNSAGEFANGSRPKSTSRALNVASARRINLRIKDCDDLRRRLQGR
jgi:hypothetical protein